jgi:hypothetical protein
MSRHFLKNRIVNLYGANNISNYQVIFIDQILATLEFED